MPPPAQQAVELSIGRMACASCASRSEKKLNKLDADTATGNFATVRAAVSFAGAVGLVCWRGPDSLEVPK